MIQKAVPTPRTIMVPKIKDWRSLEDAIDTFSDPEILRLFEEVKKAVPLLGGYPVFLRSDETSNKHDWEDSCYVADEEHLASGIRNILEFTLMVDMAGELNFRGIVLREFLELPHEFHAFNGIPVSKEFRFFIKNGACLCRHPYWFPSCMRRVDCKDWLPKLRKIQVLEPSEQIILDQYALAISKVVEPLNATDNYWSIDFCYAYERGWLVTDMALGSASFHYNTCPNASEEMKKHYPDPEDVSEVTVKGAIPKHINSLLDFMEDVEQ